VLPQKADWFASAVPSDLIITHNTFLFKSDKIFDVAFAVTVLSRK
jgi:hypothetical protein